MPDDERPYEDLVEMLEETLAELESGGLSLEDALTAYGRGVKLSDDAQRMLSEAELRIDTLRGDS